MYLGLRMFLTEFQCSKNSLVEDDLVRLQVTFGVNLGCIRISCGLASLNLVLWLRLTWYCGLASLNLVLIKLVLDRECVQ